MFLLYIIIVAILVFKNPILGVPGVALCIGIHVLKSIVFDGENDAEKQNGKKEPEYDEFDCWQDDQGF